MLNKIFVMLNKKLYILLIFIFILGATSFKPLYEMNNEEIDLLIKDLVKQKKSTISKIEFFSEISKGTPYKLGPLGEGSTGKYDKNPLINFKEVDCMTFCEQILSLSISSNYDEMFKNLQKIRYKNGKISMETRNHYPVADWLPNNSWLIKDATIDIGKNLCSETTRVISHKKFFESKGYKDIKNITPDRTITTKYIPKDKLKYIKNDLKSGDIVVFIQNKPGIFTSHMGLIIKNNKNIIFRHASMKEKCVTDLDFDELIIYLSKKKENIGLKFFRLIFIED